MCRPAARNSTPSARQGRHPTPTHLFLSQMISGLGFPSALQVKNTVFPEVTSASWGSDVIRGLSVQEMVTFLFLIHAVEINRNSTKFHRFKRKITNVQTANKPVILLCAFTWTRSSVGWGCFLQGSYVCPPC